MTVREHPGSLEDPHAIGALPPEAAVTSRLDADELPAPGSFVWKIRVLPHLQHALGEEMEPVISVLISLEGFPADTAVQIHPCQPAEFHIVASHPSIRVRTSFASEPGGRSRVRTRTAAPADPGAAVRHSQSARRGHRRRH